MTIPTDPAECRSQLKALADKPELTAAEAAHFEDLLEAVERNKVSSLRTRARSVVPAPLTDVRTATRIELRDAAMAVVETEGRHLAPAQLDQVDSLLRSPGGDVDGSVIAKRILATETPAYRSGLHEGGHF